MAERFVTSERQPTVSEKDSKKLYAEALKLKRETLSSHRDMNSLRRDINKRIDEMSEDGFKNDPDVIKFNKISGEYNVKRKALLDFIKGLPEADQEKLSGLTNLKKVEEELSSLEAVKSEEKPAERPADKKPAVGAGEMNGAEIDRMIQYSKDTARPLELSYWEARKAELEKQQHEKTEAEIDKMIKYSRDTGRLLELSYWEQRKKDFKRGKNIQEEQTMTSMPETVEPEAELKLKTEPGLEKETETLLQLTEQEKDAISVEHKDKIDRIVLEHPENPAEFIPEAVVKKENTDEIVQHADEAIDGAVTLLEEKSIAPQEKTILAKIRDRVRNKMAIYVGVGLLSFMTLKDEVRGYSSEASSAVVKVLDKSPDLKSALDFPKMVAKEAARYSVKPYLMARYIGSNDYFGLEAVKAANTLGMEGVADNMYEKSLADYIDNFSETRKVNRFTTLDKHTVRGYIDTFVQIYTGQEQPDSGAKTYQKLKGFLQEKFGAAKAYELALKVSSEKDLSPVLLESARKDAREQASILEQAIGKSNLYFNQEEGIFNVVHEGQLIDTYASRAGFMEVPGGKFVRSMGYGKTPDGQFTISSVERGYATLRWKDSFLPYGAEIRLGKTGEIEYKYRNQWYPATGADAVYFDQGKKIQPNKFEKDMKFLTERSRGESPFVKDDFYTPNGIMTRWEQNPFGPISYKLAGRPELIHSNPTDADNILHPSHGCIRLDKEDARTLESYIGSGSSKIIISSAAGESWASKP